MVKLRSGIFLLTVLLFNCLGQTHGIMRAAAASVPSILYVSPDGQTQVLQITKSMIIQRGFRPIGGGRVILNTSGDTGGGIALHNPSGNSSLTQSWVLGNRASSGGGGISLTGGQVKIETVLLIDNSVTLPSAASAGLISHGTQLTLAHTMIARNTGAQGMGYR